MAGGNVLAGGHQQRPRWFDGPEPAGCVSPAASGRVALSAEDLGRFALPTLAVEATATWRIVVHHHDRIFRQEELGSERVRSRAPGSGKVLTAEGGDLAQDAEWLAGLLVRLLPHEPEPLGLLALIRLHLARWPARLDAEGRLVLLEDQDRSLWDRRAIADAGRLIQRAAAMARPGPYQLHAAIAAVHCEAARWEDTDWAQVLSLYMMLATLDPSPVVHLNRAIALRHVAGPGEALAEVDRLRDALDRYHLFHSTRAALLRDLGRDAEAAAADQQALKLATNPAERTLLEERLAGAQLAHGIG
jgi:predicted RNA polymerase sigma factor